MKKILLVNPWIYDFAAYDFGIRPVGLLRIGEHLRRQGNEVYLIDCLSGPKEHKDEYGFSKIKKEKIAKPSFLKNIKRPFFRYGISIPDFKLALDRIGKVDSIYVTSGMTYWYPGVSLAIKLLRDSHRKAYIILGGIYATLCYKHAQSFSGANLVWKGDYLSKNMFSERGFYPAYDLLNDKGVLPIQLTRGCPYKCTYCASRILKPEFIMKDPTDLFEEVMYYHKEYRTETFVFYDDALTINSEKGIKKFLRLIIAADHTISFHTPNGLHIKHIDDELAYLLKKANFRNLRLSLETSDKDLQHFTGGKVTNNELKVTLRNLREAGFSKQDIGIYLLIGTPWLSIEKTMQDVMYINSLGVKAVLASYSPIPGTQDYKALLKHRILRKNTDPLWHNKTIFSELLSPSYSEKIREVRRFTSRLNKK